MIAIRASAVLSVLLGFAYILRLHFILRSPLADSSTFWVGLLLVAVPLATGILALFGRSTTLLAVAWGWQLGEHLPKMLSPPPCLSAAACTMRNAMVDRSGLYNAGLDLDGIAVCVVSVIGLGLYLYAYYRQRVR
jgi:hypothetical protein